MARPSYFTSKFAAPVTLLVTSQRPETFVAPTGLPSRYTALVPSAAGNCTMTVMPAGTRSDILNVESLVQSTLIGP